MLLKVVFIFILFIFYFIFYLFILVFNFYFYFYYLIFNCFNSIFLFSIFGLYHFYFLYFSTLDLFLYSFLYFYIIIFLSFYFLFFILFFYKLLTQKRTWNSRWSGDEARRWAWSSSRLAGEEYGRVGVATPSSSSSCPLIWPGNKVVTCWGRCTTGRGCPEGWSPLGGRSSGGQPTRGQPVAPARFRILALGRACVALRQSTMNSLPSSFRSRSSEP